MVREGGDGTNHTAVDADGNSDDFPGNTVKVFGIGSAALRVLDPLSFGNSAIPIITGGRASTFSTRLSDLEGWNWSRRTLRHTS